MEVTMSKQTAVELFALDLYEKGLLKGNGDEIQELLEQAKQMEKEQMKEIYGNEVIVKQNGHHLIQPFEDYYNEIYGGQDEH
jgi:hypothetical protein